VKFSSVYEQYFKGKIISYTELNFIFWYAPNDLQGAFVSLISFHFIWLHLNWPHFIWTDPFSPYSLHGWNVVSWDESYERSVTWAVGARDVITLGHTTTSPDERYIVSETGWIGELNTSVHVAWWMFDETHQRHTMYACNHYSFYTLDDRLLARRKKDEISWRRWIRATRCITPSRPIEIRPQALSTNVWRCGFWDCERTDRQAHSRQHYTELDAECDQLLTLTIVGRLLSTRWPCPPLLTVVNGSSINRRLSLVLRKNGRTDRDRCRLECSARVGGSMYAFTLSPPSEYD